MKTTITTRTIANPRRTTLAHVQSADELVSEAVERTPQRELPAQTANPRRTILNELPGAV